MESKNNTVPSGLPIIGIRGCWKTDLFTTQEGYLLIYDNQVVAVMGEAPEDMTADSVVNFRSDNYRIYMEEVESFKYSDKKDAGHQIVLSANGMKHIFVFYGKALFEMIYDHLLKR